MLTEEEKELELRAYGKRITFHTRYHWILTWLEEQPGKNLADKVWGVVDRAYRAEYAKRGGQAWALYFTLPPDDLDGKIQALSEAMECFGRAGDSERYNLAHKLITDVGWRKVERDGSLV